MRLSLARIYVFGMITTLWSVLGMSHAQAATTCPTGYTSGNFASTDYSQFGTVTNTASKTFKIGTKSSNLNDDFNLTTSITGFGASRSIVGTANTGFPTGGAFYLRQDLTTPSENNTVSYSFDKNINTLSLSLYDLDYASGSLGYSDLVTVKAYDANNNPVSFSFSNVGSRVNANSSAGTLSANNTAAVGDTTFDTNYRATINFSGDVKRVEFVYATNPMTITNPGAQFVALTFDDYCVRSDYDLQLTKTNNVNSLMSQSSTTYNIMVKNTGALSLSNISLTDPQVMGLNKTSVVCDTSVAGNVCTSAPSVSSLENGFSIASLAPNQVYALKVTADVTAYSGDVTNTVSGSNANLSGSISASDTDTVNSTFNNSTKAAGATCPAGDRMYFVGANPPAGAYASQGLSSWVAGEKSHTFSFSNGVSFVLSFTDILNLSTSQAHPYYGTISDLSTDAINIRNTSQQANVNYRIQGTVNRPITGYGFVAQDLDTDQTVGYVEQINLDTSGGKFSYSNTAALTSLNGGQSVQGTKWSNCGQTSAYPNCDINVDWGYTPANTANIISHGQVYTPDPTYIDKAHTMGYTNFYFCMAPPKLIVKKALNGNRVNDTDSNRDQFTLSVSAGSNNLKSFTTTGTGSTVTSESSGLVTLSENTTYTISEKVVNNLGNGDIANYDATYTCTNNTTGSSTVMPTQSMTYDATNKTRSFNLYNVNYGDEITCTVTNTPVQKTTFSGTVFFDNGLSGTTTTQYNGKLDTNGTATESGIAGASVKLVNCDTGNTLAAPITTTSDGTFSFSFANGDPALSGLSKVCLVETNASGYTNDTTANRLVINLTGATSYANNNFGDVNTSLLKLEKFQRIVPCTGVTDLAVYNDYTKDPLGRTADNPNAAEVPAGSCIAYKIVATNLGQIPLNNVVISDPLLKDSVKISTLNPNPPPKLVCTAGSTCTATMASDSVGDWQNGTVKTNPFQLAAGGVGTLYFNTKYQNL